MPKVNTCSAHTNRVISRTAVIRSVLMTFSLSIWNKRDVKSWCDSFPPKFYSWVYHGYYCCFNLTIIRWTLLHVLVHHVSMNVYSGMVWYVYKFNPNQRFDNIVPSNELIRKNKFPLFPPWFSSYFGDVFEWSTLNLMLHILSDAKHNSNTPEYLFFRRSFFSTRYILWRRYSVGLLVKGWQIAYPT